VWSAALSSVVLGEPRAPLAQGGFWARNVARPISTRGDRDARGHRVQRRGGWWRNDGGQLRWQRQIDDRFAGASQIRSRTWTAAG
jgi:hypothetical protein